MWGHSLGTQYRFQSGVNFMQMFMQRLWQEQLVNINGCLAFDDLFIAFLVSV